MLPRRMAGNAGIQLVAKAGLVLISMTTFALLTRYFGPAQFGRYNLILNVFGMAALVAELGLGTIAIRELAAQRDGVDRILPALLAARLVLASLAVIAATALGWALGYDRALLRLIGLYSLIFLLRGIGAGTFGSVSAAALSAWKNVIADIAEALLFVVFVAIGVATGQSFAWFVLGAVVSAALGTVLLIWLTRREGPARWRVDWRYCLYLLREAAPLAISGLFSTIYFRLDALMLSKLSGEGAVGIYAAAYKYVESTALINTVILSSLFPVLAYCFEHDRAKFGSYYRHALEWTGAFAFSLALFLYAFSDTLVLLLNGAAFGEASLVLRICCGAIVLMFVNNIGVHLLFAARQQRQMVWINLIAVAVKLAVSFILIPRYGAEGAAVATVATEILIGVAVFATVGRLHGLASPAWPLGKLAALALMIVGMIGLFHPGLGERALLLAGWTGLLLLIGMPKPRQVLKLLQDARG